MNKHKIIKCPTCQKEVLFTPESLFRPFCSERCKMIDLGAWAAEEHVIAGHELISDEFMTEEELNDILSKNLN